MAHYRIPDSQKRHEHCHGLLYAKADDVTWVYDRVPFRVTKKDDNATQKVDGVKNDKTSKTTIIVDEDKSKEKNVNKDEAGLVPPPSKKMRHVECYMCGMTPCCLDQGLFEDLGNLAEELEEDESLRPNNIRFQLYRQASTNIHGNLGQGNRVQLPWCVVFEIRDMYPKSKDEEYVGFRKKSKY